MATLDSGSKSSRLLASRRYTHDTLTSAQEAFTKTIDLTADEIYTQGHLIPSSNLPHSGSSQHLSTYSTQGQSVLKYWYRHRLTKSNINNEVWFFLNPTGSADGIVPSPDLLNVGRLLVGIGSGIPVGSNKLYKLYKLL